MNGVHDMGGMHGLGPVAPEPREPVFHEAWEGRVHAMTIASPTRGNIDAGRHQRELIPGPDYLRWTYYEKWFASLSALLLTSGLVTAAEIAAGKAAPGSPKGTPRLVAADVTAAMTRPSSYVREVATAPAFAAGDRVRARQINPTGHTRLPRYARGHVGVVERRHGAHVLPDSNAHGLGEDPRHLYTVRFAARELWGPDASARDSVSLDLWEPYLERA
ncbi:nitrile hydratase subunit beta [uncultured Phenylobacterium sp.]|uniref:nitrile hydratase subunit beta n=1 Tax=uncultured Phenylobacterium sp. TaxID=349273 RepID=UPI0025DBC4A2|nr:nitrile hydratase subunit beta [uncultured Phenylobacterium sp.]